MIGTYGSGRFCSHDCQAKYAFACASKIAIKNKQERAKIRREQYLNTEHTCEKCGKVYIRKIGISDRFCSRKCANSRVHSEETKAKISKSTTKAKISKSVTKTKNSKSATITKTQFYCKSCGKIISKTKSGYCKACLYSSAEYKEKMRQIQLSKVANGTHSGWKSRNIKSYAEIFFETVLNNNHIHYEREKHVGKYFLDFVIDNIDLEIDGKQHQYRDRKESDLERDEYLRKHGYFVYRIKWNEINSVAGKAMMKDKIDLFLDFYETYFS